MLYTDARSRNPQLARSENKRRALRRQLAQERSLDEPLALLTRLARERRRNVPSIVIPNHMQWRMVDYATERWAASTILDRPEFGRKIKFSVRDRASLEARTAWLTTDPGISDGDYLLEALNIAQHPRGGAAPIHLLGNRPSLVLAVLEYELVPLYPAAARHTASLEEHVRLVETLARTDDPPVRDWATDIFDGRTDVSWAFRHRTRRTIHRSVGSPRPDIEPITAAWDAIRFVEAGAPSVALSSLPPEICRLRRAAAQILIADTNLPEHVVAAATATAHRIVATNTCEAATDGVTEITPAPPELLATITSQPLIPALDGELPPAAGRNPSVRPRSVAGEPRIEIVARPEPRVYRATPDGSVVEVDG